MHTRYFDPDAGLGFTRQCIATALQSLSMREAHFGGPAPQVPPLSKIAQQRWGNVDRELVAHIKAAVPGAGTGVGEWGAELVAPDSRYSNEFIEYLSGVTAFDRLPLREVPRNVTIHGASSGATAYWIGESKGAKMTSLAFDADVDTSSRKIAAIVAFANELLRDASQATERWIRDALKAAVSKAIDSKFFSADAAIADVSPAGILNGVSPITTTSTPAGDLRALIAVFATAKNINESLVIVTTPTLAAAIAMTALAGGGPQLDLGPGGGELGGLRVVTSDNVPAQAIILLSTRDVWKVDLGLAVSLSRDAMLEQDSAPTGATDTPVAATATFTSMFQEDSSALRIVRNVNFGRLRPAGAVAWINNANYAVS
jgi:hypothetical protein